MALPFGGIEPLRGEAKQLGFLADAAQAMAAKRHQLVAACIGGLVFEPRGAIEVKAKGMVEAWLLNL